VKVLLFPRAFNFPGVSSGQSSVSAKAFLMDVGFSP
jgi:hypothetical protein